MGSGQVTGPARVIDDLVGTTAGRTVVITGSIHGNEPAGSVALEKVLGELRAREVPIAGRVLGLRGNTRAMARGTRYLERDLNRKWFPAALDELRAGQGKQLRAEDAEQRELLAHFDPLLEAATEPIVFLDLHSTSGKGPPFSCMADVMRNRPVAFALPIPVVLGLEEVIDGSMLGYLCDRGHVGVAVEGGQHDDPHTVDHHVSVLWLVLVAAGCVRAEHVPNLAMHRERLERAAQELPAVVEIRHRHVVHPGDGFDMTPGFVNFDPIRAGQPVARDRGGEVEAPETGLMMLPRYQGQGEDGYFVARQISPFWLGLSGWLRRLGLDRLVPWLPGVSRHDGETDTFVVNPRVARFAVQQIFHLFGYRRVRAAEGGLAFSRRRPDAG